MTTKHTPAPWELDENDLTVYSTGENAKRIADTMPHPEMPEMSDEEWAANARLIAAAPELLAQLKFALELLQDCTGLEDALEPIVDAIAKAEGGEA